MTIFLGLTLVLFLVSVVAGIILHRNVTRKLRLVQKQNMFLENTLIEKSEKEAWLQAIFDSSNVGIFIFSSQSMKMIFHNLIFEKLLMSKFRTVVTDDVSSFWEEEDWQLISHGIDTMLKGEENSFRKEVRIVHWDKKVSWIDLSISPVFLKNSPYDFMIGVSTDITNRKEAELKQAETENIYNLLVENFEDVIGLVDCDGNNLFFNKKGLEYHQVTIEELKNRPTSSFYDKETSERIIGTIRKAASAKQTVSEIIELTLHGEKYFVGFSAIPIIEADQKVTRVQTIGRNLNREMKAFKQLSDANEMMKRVLSIAQDVLYSIVINMVTGEMKYDYLSEKIEEITGYPVSFFTSQPLAFTNIIHPDDKKNQFENIQSIIKSEGWHEFTFRIITAENKTVLVKDVFENTRINESIYRIAGYLSIKNSNNQL